MSIGIATKGYQTTIVNEFTFESDLVIVVDEEIDIIVIVDEE